MTPGLSWFQNWSSGAVACSPAGEPYRTSTAPALLTVPTPSPYAPAARSANPSPLKSAAPRPSPNWSKLSPRSLTPGVSWVKYWAPAAVTPSADPVQHVDRPRIRGPEALVVLA